MLGLSKDFELHYANLTEYVAGEKALAKDAKPVLSIANRPGARNYLEIKSGRTWKHAVAPLLFAYFGVQWCTEYPKDTIVLRDYKTNSAPLTIRKSNYYNRRQDP
jgi:hypothetical protein